MIAEYIAANNGSEALGKTRRPKYRWPRHCGLFYLFGMKNLLLVRHAKSSWNQEDLTDFERPLNTRGLKDAPMMAQRLLQKKIMVEAFVSSPAVRALSTAVFFAASLGKKEKDIHLVPELYHAEPATFAATVKGLSNKYQTVALFSHNPGITAFVNQFQVALVDNMPTSGIFGVHLLTDDWANFDTAEKRFWFFDYPKNL